MRSVMANASSFLYALDFARPSIFVLGNESKGVSPELSKLCHRQVTIPMNNDVESLNVAITAALIA